MASLLDKYQSIYGPALRAMSGLPADPSQDPANVFGGGTPSIGPGSGVIAPAALAPAAIAGQSPIASVSTPPQGAAPIAASQQTGPKLSAADAMAQAQREDPKFGDKVVEKLGGAELVDKHYAELEKMGEVPVAEHHDMTRAEKGMVLMELGLRTMAYSSQPGATALGASGQAGIDVLNGIRKSQDEQAKNDREDKKLAAERGFQTQAAKAREKVGFAEREAENAQQDARTRQELDARASEGNLDRRSREKIAAEEGKARAMQGAQREKAVDAEGFTMTRDAKGNYQYDLDPQGNKIPAQSKTSLEDLTAKRFASIQAADQKAHQFDTEWQANEDDQLNRAQAEAAQIFERTRRKETKAGVAAQAPAQAQAPTSFDSIQEAIAARKANKIKAGDTVIVAGRQVQVK